MKVGHEKETEVSIIILNYNTFALTCNCIESIIQHTRKVSYEIILVDNCSKEVNADLFLDRFPGVKLIKSTTNLGFSKGNNLGIEHAKGKFILLLNSDTILINDVISKSVEQLEGNSNIGVITVKLLNSDNTIQYNCGGFPSIFRTIFEFFRMQKIFSKFGETYLWGTFFEYNKNAYPDWVWGTYFMFPAKILRELPERKLSDVFFMYCEDLLWCYEVRKLGYKIYFQSDCAIYHLHLGDNTIKKNTLIEENYKTFLKMKYNKAYIFVLQLTNKILFNKN